MTVVYVVSKPCSCPILRTTDLDTAKLAAKPGYILDAISARNEQRLKTILAGPIGCACDGTLVVDDKK